MGETTDNNLRITMKSGRQYVLTVSGTELDWLFDRLFGRVEGDFQNFDGCIVNVKEIEFLEYQEIE